MKVWTALLVLGVICLPAYGRSVDACAFNNNILWNMLAGYAGPSNKMERIHDFMANGWRPLDKGSPFFDNTLTTAVWFGYDDIVRRQLGNRNLVDKYGAQSLHVAAAMGRLTEMSMLLDAGVSANAEFHHDGEQFDTPIYAAAQNGCVEAMRLLVMHGADVNQGTSSGTTLLERAVLSRNFGAARFLLRHGYKASVDEKEHVDRILANLGMRPALRPVFWQVDRTDKGDRGKD